MEDQYKFHLEAYGCPIGVVVRKVCERKVAHNKMFGVTVLILTLEITEHPIDGTLVGSTLELTAPQLHRAARLYLGTGNWTFE